jgi:hypothetical protein
MKALFIGEGAASYYINVTLYKLAVQLSDKVLPRRL